MHAMKLSCILGILLTPIGALAERHTTQSRETTLPKISRVTERTHELLRKESKAKSESKRVQYVLQIIRLAQNIASDARLKTSHTLQRARGRLVGRLRRVQRRIEADQRESAKPLQRIKIDTAVLAQVNAARGGGPLRQAPNAGRVPQDYGPLLVELIQETISPPSWQVNGGNSTIVYYRPRRALVVRAPQSLHGDIGPLLGQLRRQ